MSFESWTILALVVTIALLARWLTKAYREIQNLKIAWSQIVRDPKALDEILGEIQFLSESADRRNWAADSIYASTAREVAEVAECSLEACASEIRRRIAVELNAA